MRKRLLPAIAVTAFLIGAFAYGLNIGRAEDAGLNRQLNGKWWASLMPGERESAVNGMLSVYAIAYTQGFFEAQDAIYGKLPRQDRRIVSGIAPSRSRPSFRRPLSYYVARINEQYLSKGAGKAAVGPYFECLQDTIVCDTETVPTIVTPRQRGLTSKSPPSSSARIKATPLPTPHPYLAAVCDGRLADFFRDSYAWEQSINQARTTVQMWVRSAPKPDDLRLQIDNLKKPKRLLVKQRIPMSRL